MSVTQEQGYLAPPNNFNNNVSNNNLADGQEVEAAALSEPGAGEIC